MAVPKKRKTSSRGKQGRAHKNVVAPSLGKCPRCGSTKISHTACEVCGYYGDKKVLSIETKLEKAAKKKAKSAEKEKTEA